MEFQVNSSPAFPQNRLTKAPWKNLRYLGSTQSGFFSAWGGKSCLEIPNHSEIFVLIAGSKMGVLFCNVNSFVTSRRGFLILFFDTKRQHFVFWNALKMVKF